MYLNVTTSDVTYLVLDAPSIPAATTGTRSVLKKFDKEYFHGYECSERAVVTASVTASSTIGSGTGTEVPKMTP